MGWVVEICQDDGDFSPKLQETQWIESWLLLSLRGQDLLGSFPCKALPLSIINTKLPLSSDSFPNVDVIEPWIKAIDTIGELQLQGFHHYLRRDDGLIILVIDEVFTSDEQRGITSQLRKIVWRSRISGE